MTPSAPPPNPERLFQTLIAYQTSAALAAAIELGLFTHVASGADTLAALAEKCGASQRGVRALANHLAAHGLLTKQGERYRCAPDAALFLDQRSPAYMGTVTGFLNSKGLASSFDSLVDAVRRGGTVLAAGGTTAVENPVWIDFARAMQPMARAYAGEVAERVCKDGLPKRVLDIAASHGIYGIEVARRAPKAEVVFQDWNNVLTVARENATAAGLGARAKYLPGSAFDVDFGTGYDAVLITHLLHHFEREACVKLLARTRKALAPGGRVAVLEFGVNDDRVTPPFAAAFDLVMLATTPRGEAFTLSEYEGMFDSAGFARCERHTLDVGGHTILVGR